MHSKSYIIIIHCVPITTQAERNLCWVDGRQNNDLPEVYFLIPRTHEYVELHGKGKLRLQLELRLLIH